MDSIDKWLKSLRLHKYTHLFKSLTYEQMLNLDEKYLIDLDITKGARNKILVSVKKLNLRQERLFNMIDDLKQDNISMKEALTVLKDMLITPIPPPLASESPCSSASPSSSIYSFASNACAATPPAAAAASILGDYPMTPTTTTSHKSPSISSLNDDHYYYHCDSDVNNKHHYSDPNQLTHLFVDTFEKVAQRLIESAGLEDNACHGIMAAIVDDCLKHNSFTKAQKARVTCFRQHFMKEQKARMASYKQHFMKGQEARMASYKQHFTNGQEARMASYKQQTRNNLLQQPQRVAYGCCLPPSLSASLSTIGSASTSTSDEEEQQTYKEYSLLGLA